MSLSTLRLPWSDSLSIILTSVLLHLQEFHIYHMPTWFLPERQLLTSDLSRKTWGPSLAPQSFTTPCATLQPHHRHGKKISSGGGSLNNPLPRRNGHWRFLSTWGWMHLVLFPVLECTAANCIQLSSHYMVAVRKPLIRAFPGARSRMCILQRCPSAVKCITIQTVRLYSKLSSQT